MDFLAIGNDGANMERQVAMVTHGHRSASSVAATPPAAYQVDPAWYMDSGSTDHLMGDMSNLTSNEPYKGNGHVHTANGSGMCISHMGQSSLLTSTCRPLHLENVPYVPQVTRNLLSASKLAQDNNVFLSKFTLLIVL
jgi:hypothetical protein